MSRFAPQIAILPIPLIPDEPIDVSITYSLRTRGDARHFGMKIASSVCVYSVHGTDPGDLVCDTFTRIGKKRLHPVVVSRLPLVIT